MYFGQTFDVSSSPKPFYGSWQRHYIRGEREMLGGQGRRRLMGIETTPDVFLEKSSTTSFFFRGETMQNGRSRAKTITDKAIYRMIEGRLPSVVP